MVEVTHTERGFALSEFNDIYGRPCILQASSLAEIDAIWFGTKGNEMHLSRTLFEDLLPHIREMLGLRGENKAGGLWYRRWHEACEREKVAAEALSSAQAEIEALRAALHDATCMIGHAMPMDTTVLAGRRLVAQEVWQTGYNLLHPKPETEAI